MKPAACLFLCLAIGLTIGCENTRTLPGAVKRHKEVEENDTPQVRADVIRLAKSHVQKYERDCRIQGVAVYPFAGTTWHTVVDCLVSEGRRNVHLDVDLFINDDGSLYWKTEYVPRRPDARPLEFASEPFGAD